MLKTMTHLFFFFSFFFFFFFFSFDRTQEKETKICRHAVRLPLSSSLVEHAVRRRTARDGQSIVERVGNY